MNREWDNRNMAAELATKGDKTAAIYLADWGETDPVDPPISQFKILVWLALLLGAFVFWHGLYALAMAGIVVLQAVLG